MRDPLSYREFENVPRDAYVAGVPGYGCLDGNGSRAIGVKARLLAEGVSRRKVILRGTSPYSCAHAHNIIAAGDSTDELNYKPFARRCRRAEGQSLVAWAGENSIFEHSPIYMPRMRPTETLQSTRLVRLLHENAFFSLPGQANSTLRAIERNLHDSCRNQMGCSTNTPVRGERSARPPILGMASRLALTPQTCVLLRSEISAM